MRVMVHNPGFLGDDELVDQFVLRQAELQRILRVVANNRGNANEHLLVIAPRGYGKTTLVRRVAVAVRRDPELGKRWFPVVFGEESYEVESAAELWLEALLHLADATADAKWRETWEEARRLRDDERVTLRALAALRSFAEERGTRLLLVIENFDRLVGGLGEADAASIRKVLQSEPRIMLLATAVRRFAGIDQPDEPMFQLFRREELQALTPAEIDTLWEKVAGSALGGRRAEAVRVLTGGNPRLVILMASFAKGRSLRVLFQDLTDLIDECSDYFRGNIESLEGQNRRVFLALASLWTPSTVKPIAEEARMEPNPASVILGRLVEQGRVEVVRQHGRNKVYQVAERLYNIYYLMRRRGGADSRVRAFVDFIAHYYESEQVPTLLARIATEACTDGEVSKEGMAIVGAMLKREQAAAARAEIVRQLPDGVWALGERPTEIYEVAEDPETLIELLRGPDGDRWVERAAARLEALREAKTPDIGLARAIAARGPVAARALRTVVRALAWEGAPDEALAIVEASAADASTRELALITCVYALLCAGQTALAERAALLLLQLSPMTWTAHFLVEKVRAEIPAHRSLAIEKLRPIHFAHPDNADVAQTLARALMASGHPAEAIEVVDTAISANPTDADLAEFRFQQALVLGDPSVLLPLAERDLQRLGLEYGALVRLASLLVRSDSSRALALLSRAIELEPQRVPAHWLAAMAHHTAGNENKARAAAEKAIRLSPAFSAVWSTLAQIAPHRILPLLRSLPKKSVDDTVRTHAARALLDHGFPELLPEAIALVEPQPHSPARSLLLAHLHGRLGRPDRALALLTPLLTDADYVRQDTTAVQRDCLRLAAAGQGRALLAALTSGSSASLLEPILVALQTREGEVVDAPLEIAEVAQDIIRRTEVLAAQGDFWRTDPLTLVVPSA